MNLSHYGALFIGYGIALLLWYVVNRMKPELWKLSDPEFENPGKEFVLLIATILLILAIGQLYMHGLLIPKIEGISFVTESINQLLIFSPALLLIRFRKQGLNSLWLPVKDLPWRIGFGVIASFIAVTGYLLVREDASIISEVYVNILSLGNTQHLVQVFLEDILIAALFIRLRAWIGTKWSIGIVAALFAASHIPAMIANGVSVGQFTSLILDTALGIGVLSVLQRARDIWWFWLVHFTMDMLQYYGSI